jgi:hypothetical protein
MCPLSTAKCDHCETEWEKIPKEVCQNLIESMPRRVEAVLRVKGGHTKYWLSTFVLIGFGQQNCSNVVTLKIM